MTLNFMQYEDVFSQTFIELLMHLRFIQELVKIYCLIVLKEYARSICYRKKTYQIVEFHNCQVL